MVEEWRLLDSGCVDIYTALAIDEATTSLVGDCKLPNTIRFAQVKPPAVTVGYFQSVEQEINIDLCRKLGIDIARRLVAGGAVYEDYRGEITYSISLKFPDPKVPLDIQKSYEVLSRGVVLGLRKLGVDAGFAPINDLVVHGKKIGGVGQSRFRNALLQEGSVLLADVENMFKVLKIPQEKIKYKGIKSVKERITVLYRECKKEVSVEEVKKSLKEGFEEALGIQLVKGEVTDREWDMARKLLQEKYATKEWIFKR
ncbi:MAG: biotin/lipoate A/B protein ligase family protein [Candidatus Bathyarchaeia archaeon]